MNRRIAWSALVVLFLGAGALYAQTEELKAYLDRGRALTKAEKLEQALPYFLLALELGEKEFGSDSPAVVPLLNDLAETYATRSDYGDAEPLFKHSLAIQERELTRYRSGIAQTLNNLGSLYEATERFAEARKLYQRVIVALQPGLGADNPSVMTALLRLAKLPGAIASTAAAGPVAAEPSAAEPAAAEPSAAEPATAEPAIRVHLTSIRQADGAAREWQRLQQVYPTLLAGLDLAVARADLGGTRGVWYRIQGGPLSEPDARALCDSFTKRGVWCSVARGTARKVPVQPPVVATTEKMTPQPPPLPAPPAAAGFRIHLTSIRNPGAAAMEWARLQRLFATLLRDLTLTVRRADLGTGHGVWYRIQGGLLGKAEARARCASFARLQLWCRVIPPPGNAADATQRSAALRVRRRGQAGARGTRRPEPGASPEPGARRFARDFIPKVLDNDPNHRGDFYRQSRARCVAVRDTSGLRGIAGGKKRPAQRVGQIGPPGARRRLGRRLPAIWDSGGPASRRAPRPCLRPRPGWVDLHP